MVTLLIDYLERVLHMPVIPLGVPDAFPLYLKAAYEIRGIDIRGRQFITAIANNLEQPPAATQKQLAAIEKLGGLPVILVCRHMHAWQRDRLIEQGIQFVVPGNQMYLPSIGLDLREHFLTLKAAPKADLSPAAQLIAVVLLDRRAFSLTSLANMTGYAKMTVSRALDELEARDWISVFEPESARRIVRVAGRTADLLKALPSPVKQRVFLERAPEVGVRAGLHALEAMTMIAADHPVYAVDQKTWKHIQETSQTAIPYGPVELEVWRYPPEILATDGLVNPFQLYLSLKDTHDERVQKALQGLMDERKWLKESKRLRNTLLLLPTPTS